MVGPKMQDFCPRINMLKGFFLKQSCNELWFVKKCQNCTDNILEANAHQLVLGAKNFKLQNPSFKTNLNDRPTYGDIFTNVSSVVEF